MTIALLDFVLLLDFAVLGVSEVFSWRTRRRSGQPASQGSSHVLTILLYFSMAVVMGLMLYHVVSRPSQCARQTVAWPSSSSSLALGCL
jgi:hypothetical protein